MTKGMITTFLNTYYHAFYNENIYTLIKLYSYKIILFENLFKPRQLRLAVYMLLTSSVLSTTSKQCFEQPAASFLVFSLIFIEY